MRVIPPITITSITSSTIAEPDTTVGEVLWVSAASYTKGNRIIRTTTHKVYEALSTHSGRVALPEVDTVYWFEVSSTNKWAMFNIYRTNPSNIVSGGFTTTLAPGTAFNSIALIDARVPDITITITSATGGGTIYGPITQSLVSREVFNYYDYFFLPFNYKENTIIRSIPSYADAIVTVSSTSSGTIGHVIFGTSRYIGFTQKGHTNDALNFSLITRDAYGNATLVPRRSVPKTSQKIVVKKSDLTSVISLRETLNARPAVWSGLDDSTEGYFNALLILGFYKEFSLTIDNPMYLNCTLELEEL